MLDFCDYNTSRYLTTFQIVIIMTARILNSVVFRTDMLEEDLDGTPLDMVFIMISTAPNTFSALAYLWFYRVVSVPASAFCTEFSNSLVQIISPGMVEFPTESIQ